jgi:outer membrane protein OmpA-like peptidoglycan-associated protein
MMKQEVRFFFYGLIKPILIIFSFLIFSSCQAQKVSQSALRLAKMHYQNGEALSSQHKYDEAIEEYKKAYDNNPALSDALFAIGDSYAALHDVENSKKYYEEYIKVKPGNTDAYFALGMLMKDNGKYDEAAGYFETFISKEDKNQELIQKAKGYLADSKFASEAVKHPVPFDPKSVGDKVNTSDPEYFPSVSADESTLSFCRKVGRMQEDIFISKKDANQQWTQAVPISNLINTEHDEGALCISANGQYIFYSSNKPDENYGSQDIYFSYLIGNTWSKPYNAGPMINTQYWDTHPSLSADGRTLYWLSTRPGGFGNADIWCSTLDSNDKWTTAKNLGPTINTQAQEFTPFIYADGKTLYFSSSGHPGMGGKDIYYSIKDSLGNWGTPVNLGYPINTPNSESCFILSANGKTAYFAREDKNDRNNIDIYTFMMPESEQPKAVAYLKGIVSDIKTGKIVKANIQLIDLETGKIAAAMQSNSVSGEYLVCLPPGKNYALNVSASGYLFYSENFSLKVKAANDPMERNIRMKPIEAGENIVLNNIFFETNESSLKPESMVELNKVFSFLTENKTVKLEISGHTDNSGDKSFNQKLSENRAKAVVNYLIAKGIDASRLSSKGYGDTKPVAPNTNPENKAKNRRTEMAVLSR